MSNSGDQSFNRQVIEEFRANNGYVGGPFEGARLLLLTTCGARTGQSHTVPLGYLNDENDRMLVIASAGGAPRHPAWYHNLRANPRVTVESGVFTFTAVATVLDGAERDAMFARAVEGEPGWLEYQQRSGRHLPVVAFTVVDGGPNMTGGWGDGLKAIHDGFRRELALVRAEVAQSGSSLGAQLRINCLSVCQFLHTHHEHEDTYVFPAIVESSPELRPVLDKLGEEHVEIAHLLEELQSVVQRDTQNPVDLLATVDRLIADLEAHLDYEEEQLIPLLNSATLNLTE